MESIDIRIQKEWNEFEKEELHKTALSAFVQNGLEQDKILLSLNVASIGFFINFLTSFKIETKSGLMTLIVIGLSILCFLISTTSILLIFSENKKYLKELLKNNFQDNKSLDILDKVRLWTFILGIIFGVIFSIFIVINNIKLKEQNVENQQKVVKTENIGKKSLNELGSHINNVNSEKKTNESLNQLASHMNGDGKSNTQDSKIQESQKNE